MCVEIITTIMFGHFNHISYPLDAFKKFLSTLNRLKFEKKHNFTGIYLESFLDTCFVCTLK